MKPDPLDRLLGSEKAVLPSPGFTASVMAAVRHEAALVSPLAFPWRRAAPLLILCGAAIVAVGISLVAALASAPLPTIQDLDRLAEAARSSGVVQALFWAGLGLLVSYLSVRLAARGATLPE